jgi:cobalamin biosynthetic protein CobC
VFFSPSAPEHGGRLRAAAAKSDIALADWLDLSTGVNPAGWPSPRPFPLLPPEVWQRLPEADDGLETAAAAYYGNPRLLPLPGSQAAIQLLPHGFPPAAIACLAPLYAEHPHAWRTAGHKAQLLPAGHLTSALAAATPYVLLCNPNNPTGHCLEREMLLEAAQNLARRGGWLFVDEAFIDAQPEMSVTAEAGSDAYPNLVVLRSLGKFFGLAGARAGFLFGTEALRATLAARLGPWAVSHPARWAATQALNDRDWQSRARKTLVRDAKRLAACLAPIAKATLTHTPLFATLHTPQAKPLFDFLCARGILTRWFPSEKYLRFGLPGDEKNWSRLETAVKAWIDSGRK